MKKEDFYSVGDIVKLKSGGPHMTVRELTTNLDRQYTGSYKCQWFAGKKLDTGVFPHDSLVKVEEES
ncbi:DUF2158 domain-containing protein [Salinicola sp. CR57]|uniref:YodC family protein n=1 Tax=Salinicola sp. CR57 TaxID=1949086 RepID=UPI000DA1ACB8|nr:DUF2158 domain-containing protein [Salinicola sp. CR57]